MKLLFCDNTLWGLINFRGSVMRHFSELGHEIVVVAPDDHHTEMKAHVPDFVRFVPVQLNRTSRNPLDDLRYMLKLIKVYRQERPDFIFHYTIKPNIYGTLAAAICGIPTVAVVAGLGYAFQQDASLTARVAKHLYRFALGFSKRVFVLNESNYRTLVDLKMVHEDKLQLLPFGEGIDTNELSEGEPLFVDTPVTFMMVARLLYDKGYAEFVEAARTLTDKGVRASWCIMGPIDESYPKAVSRDTVDADVADGTISYLGFSSHPLDFMAKAGICIVLPSYHEGMSRSLMEACALGRPVITTDIPGCREMVKEGKNGYLVPPQNAEALADAMLRYVSLTPEEKRAMGRESRRIAVNCYDVSNVISVYDNVLATFAKKKG